MLTSRTILTIAFIALLVMVLFPPFKAEIIGNDASEHFAGYRPFTLPPSDHLIGPDKDGKMAQLAALYSYRIDGGRLGKQLLGLGVITAVALFRSNRKGI